MEWCRFRAHAMQYAKEVELLLEEMRRVLAFLEWDKLRWKKRALNQRTDTTTRLPTSFPSQGKSAAFEEGLSSYALRQASICQRRAATSGMTYLHFAITDRAAGID